MGQPTTDDELNVNIFQQMLNRYHDFILKNKEAATTVETSLRSLLYFFPGRLRDSELKLELAYSAIGLFSLYNDLIILKHKKLTGEDLLGKLELSSLGTTKWISAIRHIQLPMEMFFRQHGGEESAFNSAFFIEVIKAFLKLKLLTDRGGKVVGSYTVPSATEALSLEVKGKPPSTIRPRRNVSSSKWQSFKLQTRYGSKGSIVERDSSFYQTLAEISFIVRPIIYLLAMMKYGRKSWKPWIISFVIEFSSLFHLLKSMVLFTEREKQEVTKRVGLLFWYLLRSPLFEAILSRKPLFVTNLLNRIKSVPILNSVGEILEYYLRVYREYYFWTSGT